MSIFTSCARMKVFLCIPLSEYVLLLYFQVDVVVCYSKMTGSMRTSLQNQKRPLVHIWSGGTSTNRSTSTSGSLRYSRGGSSITTIKSSTRTHSENNSIRFVSDSRKHSPELSPIEQSGLSLPGLSGIHANITFPPTTLYHAREDSIAQRSLARSRREIFSYTLSIPTTINEESSRSSKTPSPHPERATFKSICDGFEGENDIEWVESKILESRLNRFKMETQMRNKRIEKNSSAGTSDSSSAQSLKQVKFQSCEDFSMLGNQSKVTSPAKTDCSSDLNETWVGSRQKEGNPKCETNMGNISQRVPLIVTDLISDVQNNMAICGEGSQDGLGLHQNNMAMCGQNSQDGLRLHQKDESRDSGAESDIEVSVSETDMLLSGDNIEMDTKQSGLKAAPELTDNETTDSSNI